MGRRYLCTLVEVWCERIFILDDLIAEKHPEPLSDPVEQIHPDGN